MKEIEKVAREVLGLVDSSEFQIVRAGNCVEIRRGSLVVLAFVESMDEMGYFVHALRNGKFMAVDSYNRNQSMLAALRLVHEGVRHG